MYFQLTGTNVRIMGSVHLFPAGSLMPRWTSDAYAWAESLMLEADLSTVEECLIGPVGYDLQNILSPELWSLLEKNWLLDKELLHRILPWGVAFYVGNFKAEVMQGVERYMTNRANDDGKQLDYLETAADFAAHLNALLLEDVEPGLADAIAEIDNNQRNHKRLYGDWSGRHLDTLRSRFRKKQIFTNENVFNAILANRNKAWVPVIASRLDSPSRLLIVVGALHLSGPQNLLDLLGVPYEAIA